jgi:hypothetical protein
MVWTALHSYLLVDLETHSQSFTATLEPPAFISINYLALLFTYRVSLFTALLLYFLLHVTTQAHEHDGKGGGGRKSGGLRGH